MLPQAISRTRHLYLTPDAQRFWQDGQPATSLETRVPLRRLLAALVRQRMLAPGEPLSVQAAFEEGWPGERAHPDAAATRVYTAVHSLRRLGLRGVLVRRRGGYVLDADLSVT
jgi:hypothetical protein